VNPLTSFAGSFAFAEDVKVDPRETLEASLCEGIRLLEAKERNAFLEGFVTPTDLNEYTKGKSLDELAKDFGEQKSLMLLKVLKEIKGATPILKKTATEVTFGFDKAKIGKKKAVAFVKMGKYWHIQN
jgi:hypothetical protein